MGGRRPHRSKLANDLYRNARVSIREASCGTEATRCKPASVTSRELGALDAIGVFVQRCCKGRHADLLASTAFRTALALIQVSR
jgi:hypothetical protein